MIVCTEKKNISMKLYVDDFQRKFVRDSASRMYEPAKRRDQTPKRFRHSFTSYWEQKMLKLYANGENIAWHHWREQESAHKRYRRPYDKYWNYMAKFCHFHLYRDAEVPVNLIKRSTMILLSENRGEKKTRWSVPKNFRIFGSWQCAKCLAWFSTRLADFWSWQLSDLVPGGT